MVAALAVSIPSSEYGICIFKRNIWFCFRNKSCQFVLFYKPETGINQLEFFLKCLLEKKKQICMKVQNNKMVWLVFSKFSDHCNS